MFYEIDGRDVRSIAAVANFTVVFVDISGSRPLSTLLPMLESYEKVLKPRLFIVKNFRLYRLRMSLHFLQEELRFTKETDLLEDFEGAP